MISLFLLFLLCAIAGGAVLAVQLLGTVLGIGGDELDVDFDVDMDHGDESGMLFGLISFRTIVAALTFFGLFGLLAHSLHWPPIGQIALAATGGLFALVIVWWLYRALKRLSQDATIRLDQAIGHEANVYTPIPGSNRGAGKVMLNFHGRVEEYAATTQEFETIPVGAIVRVVAVHGGTALEVETVHAPKPGVRQATASSN